MVAPSARGLPACPVCQGASDRVRPAPGWGEWRACTACALEFVHPMRLPETPEELFDGAYRGRRNESAMHEFNDRLRIRELLMTEPQLWFWTPAFAKAIQWLEGRVPQGAEIMEIGCGLGFVLQTLRQEGYRPSGLDVAEAVVELNRRDGFRVWHGTIFTVPSGWVDPAAVMAFFMLHHLEDPLAFLKAIRSLWPRVPLALAQYGPTNRDHIRSSPPRTLTRWNESSLRTLLHEAGYRSEVQTISGTGTERRFLRPLRRLLKRTIVAPRLYLLTRRFEHYVLPGVLRPVGKHGHVLLAFAEPILGGDGPHAE